MRSRIGLSDILGSGATGYAPGEETSSQESSFECAIAMHATAAETCDFSCGIEAGEGLTLCLEDAAREISFYATKGFAGED